MKSQLKPVDRRSFIKTSSLFTIGTLGVSPLFASNETLPTGNFYQNDDINIIGPKEGYSPQIGTLVSMMNWMRMVILYPIKDMSVSDLDFLVDEKANTIGAMLMHLAATERFYQLHTFENKKWGDWPKEDIEKWTVASRLGKTARRDIKGKPLDYYLEALSEVRADTLKEFKNRDDAWLMHVDKEFPWGPTNNYCKWFHVCEHESNHNGVFKFIKSRII